jgi:MYXO-CTERM domain-containing protein
MKPSAFVLVLPALLLGLGSAEAHFKLEQPADRLQTDADGEPLGAAGTQKTNPCGDGTASGIVTTVQAGSTLHIKLTETIAHGGHYRVALVPKLNLVTTDIPEPAVTLKAGQCDTAAIESPAVAPVLADNLFPHTQAQAVAGKVWETDVTLPNQTGDATLQIIEFMAPHAPQCFYHHCAELKIVAAAGGAGGDSGADAGAGGGNGAADSSGCSVGEGSPPSAFGILAFGVVVAFSMVRRRRATTR